MKKKAMIAVIFVGVLFAGLCFLSSNPIISCKIDIPESYSAAIEAQAKGGVLPKASPDPRLRDGRQFFRK